MSSLAIYLLFLLAELLFLMSSFKVAINFWWMLFVGLSLQSMYRRMYLFTNSVMAFL